MFSYALLILICLGTTLLVMLLYGVRPKPNKTLLYTFLICLLLMLVFNTYLTALPIVVYNMNSILGIKIISFPIEDIGYLIAVVLLLPGLYRKLSNEPRNPKRIKKAEDKDHS